MGKVGPYEYMSCINPLSSLIIWNNLLSALVICINLLVEFVVILSLKIIIQSYENRQFGTSLENRRKHGQRYICNR